MNQSTRTPEQSSRQVLRRLRERVAPLHLRTKLRVLRHGLQYRSILGYTEIDGWLTPTEAVRLYDLAQATPESRPVVVEIGSWQGKSSVVLTHGLAQKHDAHLYCIDPFNADGDQFSRDEYQRREATLSGSLKDRFEANMRRHGISDCVHPLAGYSQDFATDFVERIDLLFIDGNHAYDAVKRDFNDWSPLVKPGGVVAFHDVAAAGEQIGPWQVVNESLRRNAEWEFVGHWDSLYAARYVGSHVMPTPRSRRSTLTSREKIPVEQCA
jgi:predicted O-methyltransferase YrrM